MKYEEYHNAIKEIMMGVAKDFESGKCKTMLEAKAEWDKEYQALTAEAGEEKKLSNISVAKAIALYCSKEFIAKWDREIAEEGEKLRQQGKSVKEIAKILGVCPSKVEQTRFRITNAAKKPRPETCPITVAEIQKIRDSLPDEFEMMVEHDYLDRRGFKHRYLQKEYLKVKAKYPNFVETDKGDFRYPDIIIGIRKLCEI